MSGFFITIEGIDGCGKTTQAALLADSLRTANHSVCLTREPGGTQIGQRIREILLSPLHTMPHISELLLYLADRSIHIAQVVQPALQNGQIVICERHADSTLAYQGYGRGLDLDLLLSLNSLVVSDISPDLTIVLDIPAASTRLDADRLDRLESEGQEFLARVADGFRKLAHDHPQRVKLVEGSADVQTVHDRVAELVQQLLNAEPPPGGRR